MQVHHKIGQKAQLLAFWAEVIAVIGYALLVSSTCSMLLPGSESHSKSCLYHIPWTSFRLDFAYMSFSILLFGLEDRSDSAPVTVVLRGTPAVSASRT
jgi:hypothetical protein